MTITPLWALGWETQSLLEGNAADGTTLPTISATKAYTGAYSLRFEPNTFAYGRSIPATTELRAGAMFNHAGAGGSTGTDNAAAIIFQLVASNGTKWRVAWQPADALLQLMQDTTVLDTVAIAGVDFSITDVWYAASVAFKAADIAGYFKFYVGGDEVLSYEGDTISDAVGSGDIGAVMVGGQTAVNLNRWNDYLYVDDFYAVDTAGEGAGPASTRRFLWAIADGNGQANAWTGSDGNSTDNYLLIDDAPPDGDTTYVKATSATLVDQYTHAAVTVPADWVPVRVIPTVISEKLDAGVATTIKLGLWKATLETDSAELALPTSYGLVQTFINALPDASAMTEANINATELRLVSSGAFS